MTDGPLVSVIIPAYNVGWCVRRALDSVLAQSYRQYELVVVNDGSTDDTGAVLASYADKLRIIEQQNKGMCNARNVGIQAAQGEFIAFLDADDWWLPAKLERQIRLMLSNPEIGYSSTTARVESQTGGLLNLWQCPHIHGNILKTLFMHHAAIAGGCSSVVVRKTLLEKVGLFDEELRGFEDPDLWIRLAAVTDYACIDEPLVTILRRENSVSRNLEAMRDSSLKSIRKNRTLLPTELQGAFWHDSLAGVYADYAKAYYRAGYRAAALADIFRAFIHAPIRRSRFCLGLLKDIALGRSL